ncbi:MAG TPA: enoyl-CoA hydratase-related protein [Mycobacteriales bacterium]|nr:enoyl-CoA hydratase-related protein [Mycobacteriales bacterium]
MPVNVDADGRVLRIRLDRPDARNAFDWETLEELCAAFTRLRDDDDVWVGVLTGSGDQAFCTGADLKKLPLQAAEKQAAGIEPPATIMADLDPGKPLVCAVNGDALGGGLELALACDLRIAADHALLGLPEARWSLIPAGGGTQRLPRIIGPARALELMLTATPIPAAQALSWGLVHRVVPADRLAAETAEVVDALLAVGPVAARAIRRLVYDGAELPLAEGLAREREAATTVMRSADAAEGVLSFAQRRAPVWIGA